MQKELQKKAFFFSEIITSALIPLKLSLLTTEYLSSAINVSKKSPKMFHITKTDFFQLNCFRSDH